MMLVTATLILLLLDIGNVLANQCFPRSYIIIKGGPSLPADEIISKHNITSLHVMLGCHNLCKDEEKCVGFNYRTTKNVENCQLTNVTKEREKAKTGDWVLMLDIEATKNEKRKRENVNESADTCLPGYAKVGKNCTDIDECFNVSAKVCHTNAYCIYTNGSYNCTCLSGYSGNGKNCTDIDECSNLSAKTLTNAQMYLPKN
ncbi:cysteine-rich with EGF-like domain protein 2-B [Dendronephthya gigantea]|uniref:cysteine-rich with EGF-like domain protein 2-B n=1 Tax=Dendronephthya gigantea TaxID=151771 RepID=UPI00106C2ECC|nr:cysteine-rich with EGF-like domain protein 2-B [Dendronephthya gigantea]